MSCNNFFRLPLWSLFLKSTLPDIGIAWADFFVGKALYDLYMKGPTESGRSPNPFPK